MSSPFLALPGSAHLAANALAFAVEDRYPVSPGHTLVVPRREVSTWFDATRAEQVAILELVDVVKGKLDAAHVARWVRRMRQDGKHLQDIARQAGWDQDAERALAVGRVIYLRLRPDVRLWQSREAFERADRSALASALAG